MAGLLGPTLISLSVTEWIHLDVFTAALDRSFVPHGYRIGTVCVKDDVMQYNRQVYACACVFLSTP
jgi:hypothetical protein